MIFEHSIPPWLIWTGLAMGVAVFIHSVRRDLPWTRQSAPLIALRTVVLLLLAWCIFIPGIRALACARREAPHRRCPGRVAEYDTGTFTRPADPLGYRLQGSRSAMDSRPCREMRDRPVRVRGERGSAGNTGQCSSAHTRR